MKLAKLLGNWKKGLNFAVVSLFKTYYASPKTVKLMNQQTLYNIDLIKVDSIVWLFEKYVMQWGVDIRTIQLKHYFMYIKDTYLT